LSANINRLPLVPHAVPVRATRARTIDFNSLLIGANAAVACLVLFASSWTNGNPYIDGESIGLAALLCAQTHVALVLERRRRDPFVLLLAFEMIFYYSLRIFTLVVYPFSTVFDRYPYYSQDSNQALIFIIIANLMLYGGLWAVRSPDPAPESTRWRAVAPGRVILLLVSAIGTTYFTQSFSTQGDVPRALDFLSLFLTANIIVLMALTYYFLFRETLSKRFAATLGLLILIDMIVHTLAGSRSAIITFVQDCVFVALALWGRIRFRRAHVVIGLVVSPLVLLLLIGSFLVSSYNRSSREIGASFDIRRAITSATDAGSQLSLDSEIGVALAPMLARVGFFDISAEIIAHRAEYRSVINTSAYGKSIVDNILTPGFDVFDWPKTGNALQFIYMDWGTPSKRDVPESYQSDPLGLYGEFYALFGYASLPLMFLASYGIKFLYQRLRSSSPFFLVIKRVIVLYVFLELLRSFGLDWILAELVPLVAAIYLYSFFFASKRV
jgi:hypothetical protein